MIPGTHNMQDLYKDDTWDGIELTFKDSSTYEPLDLTGVDIACDFKFGKKTGALQKRLTLGAGIVMVDAVGGTIQFSPFLVDWKIGTYYYDVQFTYSDGTVKTFLRGEVNVIQDITSSND